MRERYNGGYAWLLWYLAMGFDILWYISVIMNSLRHSSKSTIREMQYVWISQVERVTVTLYIYFI